MHYPIVIIGAGASGLATAYHLSKQHQKIAILEAKPHTGGRAHTISLPGFSQPVETGAEFIHGNLPETIKLLKEAGINYHKVGGRLWKHQNGRLELQEDFIEHADQLMKRLKNLKEDMSVKDFLDTYFARVIYDEMKSSVIKFVEGYDAADADRASSFALRDEWMGEDEAQYSIEGGYKMLIAYLETKCLSNGCEIHLSTIVKEIRWQPGNVEVFIEGGDTFTADKILITVPVAMMVAGVPGGIKFSPHLPQINAAAAQIGYGGVIKIILQFTERFWEQAEDMYFLFSDETIPTWWTRLPDKTSVLTGWLAGPAADRFAESSDESILEASIKSLSVIFNIESDRLRSWLVASSVNNWIADPFCSGGYSYSTVGSEEAKQVFRVPIADTIYFAGEAYGDEAGTVEAALISARSVLSHLH